METNKNQKIAIVSMYCRFPGSNNVEEFWSNLVTNKNCITYFSDKELIDAGVNYELLTKPNYVKARGILNDIDKIDEHLFDLSPYELKIMDPQHRLFLEACVIALRMSQNNNILSSKACGVFAGMSDNTYLMENLLKNKKFLKTYNPYQTSLLNSGHFLANRISYQLNLIGPSVNVSTACSTSNVAVIMACQSLLTYQCDIAIAGAVSIRLPQYRGYLYQKEGILSHDGQCRPFDAKATGTVSGSGVGVIVLKRLNDAIECGDNIEAVIRNFAVNNDGKNKSSFTAPSVIEQARCIAMAINDKFTAESIGYVEAHGTGTIVGDPIEFEALTKAFKHFTNNYNYCSLGSVKSNIGHADAAAGIAGIIKTVLILKNKVIPALYNFDRLNPEISDKKSPFYINSNNAKWSCENNQYLAGINCLGIGGTNTFIVLEAAASCMQALNKKNFQDRQLNQDKKTDNNAHIEQKKTSYWIEPNRTRQNTDYSDFELYEQKWLVSNIKHINGCAYDNEPCLFFMNNISDNINIGHLLGLNKVIKVYKGISFRYNENLVFEINPSNQKDFHELYHWLLINNCLPKFVVYCWALKDHPPQLTSFKKIIKNSAFFDIISIVKHFISFFEDEIINFSILTNDASFISKDEAIFPHTSFANSLSQVMEHEFSFSSKVIDIDLIENSNGRLSYQYDLLSNNDEKIIVYRNGLRFVQELKKCKTIVSSVKSILYNRETYLITGGTGRLGKELALYLYNKYDANIIFLYIHEKTKDYLNEIANLFPRKNSVLFIKADVSNYKELNSAFELASATYGEIDGIFHLAGIVNENIKIPIKHLSRHEAISQLKPKIQGLINLEALSARYKFKFCVSFSSIASLIGGKGFGCYSVSNAYLDYFCQSKCYDKQDVPIWISINWGEFNLKNSSEAFKLMEYCLSCNKRNNYIISSSKYLVKKIKPRKINSEPLSLSKLDVEIALCKLFSECLGLTTIQPSQSFYEIGGDSLAALSLLENINTIFSSRLTLIDIIQAPTPRDLALKIKEKNNKNLHTCVVKLKKGNASLPPLFLVHPLSGTVWCYLKLIECYGIDRTIYGIQDPSIVSGVNFNSLAEMAIYYKELILSIQPTGPYFLCGYSLGGNICVEIAALIEASGETIGKVFLIDSWAFISSSLLSKEMLQSRMNEHAKYVMNIISNKLKNEDTLLEKLFYRMKLLKNNTHAKITSPIVLFKATHLLDEYKEIEEASNHWGNLALNDILIYPIEGTHISILDNNGITSIANLINKNLV